MKGNHVDIIYLDMKKDMKKNLRGDFEKLLLYLAYGGKEKTNISWRF